MAKKNWIAEAIKPSRAGVLRKKLGVKAGQKISTEKLDKAESSKNPKLKKEAVLAKTLGKLRKK